MNKKVHRPGVRAGYDEWAETYDSTPNPLVALDRRYTMNLLHPRSGERILDAGCGTGANLRALMRAGSRTVGLDFSRGMLRVARRRLGPVALAQADLNAELPVRPSAFDAVLCSLVGEHLQNPRRFFCQALAALTTGGRLVFSVFHPEVASTGVEANFELAGVEYRLGAHRHSIDDYVTAMEDAGFGRVRAHEFRGDAALAAQVGAARKYVGRPLLLVVEARGAA
jgi:SAM-dependent methyltransferase